MNRKEIEKFLEYAGIAISALNYQKQSDDVDEAGSNGYWDMAGDIINEALESENTSALQSLLYQLLRR